MTAPEVERLIKAWGQASRRDTMLPYLGTNTCGEVADLLATTQRELAEANERWDHFQKLASDHRDELERELAEAREHGHDSFKLACMWQDQAKEARARAEVSEKALREARRGLNMVHDGLMDPTRPRQSVGEVAAYWLEQTDAALAALTTEGRKNG